MTAIATTNQPSLPPSVPLMLNPSTFAHGPNDPTTISAALPTTHPNNACCRVISSSIARRRSCSVVGAYGRCRTPDRDPVTGVCAAGVLDQGRGPLGAAVLHPVAQPPRNREQPLEVELDPRPRFLGDLVLDGQVEVVGAVVESPKRILVLRQHGRAHVLHVVEEDPGERDPPAVLFRRDLAAAERGAVGLVRPAEEREEATRLVLEVPRALQVLEPLLQR